MKKINVIFKDVSKVKNHLITRWESNPYSRGGYSYV
jgi:hypothetical protein